MITGCNAWRHVNQRPRRGAMFTVVERWGITGISMVYRCTPCTLDALHGNIILQVRIRR